MATSTWERPPRSRKCPNSPYSRSSIPANLDSSDRPRNATYRILDPSSILSFAAARPAASTNIAQPNDTGSMTQWLNRVLVVRCFVAGSLGFVFGHKLPRLGLAIPAAALVVDAALGVDPNLAAGFSGGDLRTGRRARRCLGRRLGRSRSCAGISWNCGLCGGGVGVGRTRLRLRQSRRNADRDYQEESKHPKRKFGLGMIHFSSQVAL